jgi:hypothetical protein
VARFLWGSAAVLFLALILLAVFTRYDPGSPPLLLNPSVPLVHEGVAMEMICGKQPTREAGNTPGKAAALPEWADERWTQRKRRGDCVVYYHHLRAGD